VVRLGNSSGVMMVSLNERRGVETSGGGLDEVVGGPNEW
jgi:hypothetical protein